VKTLEEISEEMDRVNNIIADANILWNFLSDQYVALLKQQEETK
jgi:hypothetical protein